MGNYIYNLFFLKKDTIIYEDNSIPYYTSTKKTYDVLEQELKKSQTKTCNRLQLNNYYYDNLNKSGINLLQ